jgi:serine/threonine protein phosphatase PrpC
MAKAQNKLKWGVLGKSQLGASHVRHNLPNQDAFNYSSLPDGSCPVVVAVADGHGSAKTFRSHIGATIAVKTAVEVCNDFLKGVGNAPVSAIKNAAEQHIPPRIFQTWKRRVTEHFARNPFTREELDRLAKEASPADCDRMVRADRPQLAYGSTLLVAFVTDEYLVAFQLGDGDILAVSDVSGDTGYFIPKDESLIANETTSLCQDDALKYVRYRFQVFQDRPPALVILSTDGYANSFASSAGFLKAGTDFLDILQTEGANSLQTNLPTWLEEASREGSGDDITLGIIYRIQPMPTLRSHPNEPGDTARTIAGDGTSTGSASLPSSSATDKATPNGSQSTKPTAPPACDAPDGPQLSSPMPEVEPATVSPETEGSSEEAEPTGHDAAASLDGPRPSVALAYSSSSSSQRGLIEDEDKKFPFRRFLSGPRRLWGGRKGKN